MLSIPLLTILISIFANSVFCKTKFLRPPEWNSDVDSKAGMEENIRYKVGDTIQLLWETDIEEFDLYVVQQLRTMVWPRLLDSSSTEWTAEWDVSGSMKNNEDSVYSFTLLGRDSMAATQLFNVTAPNLEATTVTTLQTSTTTRSTSSQQEGTSTGQPISTSTTTDQSPNKETSSDTGPDSDSGMSKGEIAGAAVGGTIGGLILLGAVGWLVWRRFVRSKKDADVSVVSQTQQQQFYSYESKAELPGDPAVEVYPSGYARSHPGLHEAP